MYAINKLRADGVIDFAADLSDWDYTEETIVNNNNLRVHPTSAGMKRMADCAYNTITK
jgi:hypothetical protein